MRKNPLLAIFTTVFIDLVGFGILIPVFPLLIAADSPFRVTPDDWSFTQGLVMLGWLQAVYPFFTFIAAPILGQLSDRYGRKPVLAISIFGTSIGYVLFAIGISTGNLPLLFASRALDGFTGGNLAVANAAIGDISTNENRAKNFGFLGAAFGMGFIIGPYLGGKLSSPNASFYGLFDTPHWFNATTPFWFAAIIAMLNCVAVLTTFPETIKEKFHAGRINATQSIQNVVNGFRSERLRVVLIAGFLFSSGFTFFTTFFGIYLKNNFDFSASKTGDYFAIVGLFIAFSQAVLVARVAKKLVDFKVLRFSLFGNAIMMLFYFAVPTSFSFGLYLVIPLFTAFNGLTMANMTSLVSRSAEPGQQGQAMGIYSSVQSLAQVPASILVGYITTSVTSSQPLVVASICIALGGLLFLLFFKPKYVSSVPGAQMGAPSH
jgi:DHA1 family tetracycline resistance protein-like MFS transporter